MEPALAATGGRLRDRIQRLLNTPETRRISAAPVVALALLIGVSVALLAQNPPLRPSLRRRRRQRLLLRRPRRQALPRCRLPRLHPPIPNAPCTTARCRHPLLRLLLRAANQRARVPAWGKGSGGGIGTPPAGGIGKGSGGGIGAPPAGGIGEGSGGGIGTPPAGGIGRGPVGSGPGSGPAARSTGVAPPAPPPPPPPPPGSRHMTAAEHAQFDQQRAALERARQTLEAQRAFLEISRQAFEVDRQQLEKARQLLEKTLKEQADKLQFALSPEVQKKLEELAPADGRARPAGIGQSLA
jgi:hypothetical protein